MARTALTVRQELHYNAEESALLETIRAARGARSKSEALRQLIREEHARATARQQRRDARQADGPLTEEN